MSVNFHNGEPSSFRTRAYTTGSMWEILKKKRQAIGFPQSVLSKSVFLGPRSGTPKQERTVKRVSEYMDCDKRHRRRHWSEFDGGKESGTMPDFPQTESHNEDCEKPDVPRIRVSTTSTRDTRLLMPYTPDASPILYRKQRTNSLPSDMASFDGKDMVESMYLYRRYSVTSKCMYLGESLRSISRERHSSIGSATSYNDDDVISREEGNNSGGTTFNVSSTSSVCVPALSLLVFGETFSDVSTFTETIVSLGELEDDDVFVDESVGCPSQRCIFVAIAEDEYYVTIHQATSAKDIPATEGMDAYVIFLPRHVTTAWCHEILQELKSRKVLPNIIFLITTKPQVPICRDLEQLVGEYDCSHVALTGPLLKANAYHVLEEIVNQIHVTRETMDSGLKQKLKRTRISAGDSVDKHMLFSRFFWRTFSTKSCENLLAL